MSEKPTVGSCRCGYIRFESSKSATRPCFCHCQSCRAATGAPFMAWVEIEMDAIEFTHGQLAQHQSSQGVSRGFCPKCGMSLSYHSAQNSSTIDIALAALENPDDLTPERHIWISDKVPWLEIKDGLPQFEGWSD